MGGAILLLLTLLSEGALAVGGAGGGFAGSIHDSAPHIESTIPVHECTDDRVGSFLMLNWSWNVIAEITFVLLVLVLGFCILQVHYYAEIQAAELEGLEAVSRNFSIRSMGSKWDIENPMPRSIAGISD